MGVVDALEIECQIDEFDLLIGRVGVAEIYSDTTKAVEQFKELVRKDRAKALQTLQMGDAVITSIAGNQGADRVPPRQWNAMLDRATEEGLTTTVVNKKTRTTAKKGQTRKLAFNLRGEGAVHKLVMGTKQEYYALQQEINIIAVLKNQLWCPWRKAYL